MFRIWSLNADFKGIFQQRRVLMHIFLEIIILPLLRMYSEMVQWLRIWVSVLTIPNLNPGRMSDLFSFLFPQLDIVKAMLFLCV